MAIANGVRSPLHVATCRVGRIITSLYKCRVICLLTFDLYLAIEWLCFCCYSSSESKPRLLSLFFSLTPYLSYPLQEKASKWILHS